MFTTKKIHPCRSRTEYAWGGKSFEQAQSNHAPSILALFCNLLLLLGLTTMAVAQPGTITTVAGTGTAGFSGDGGAATAAQLNRPIEIEVDGTGNLYIADQFNHRIRKVDAITGIITTFAGTGAAGFSGDGGPATSASLNFPTDIRPDESGNFYIADAANVRVRKVNTSGTITTVAGTGIAGFSGDGGLATSARLNEPIRLLSDRTGNFYIADRANDRVRKVNASGIITTIAGTGIAGFSGDGGPSYCRTIEFACGFGV